MKVILLEDVKSMGKKGDIVKASDGHARNFLIPKGIALEANAKNLNDLKLAKAREEKAAKESLDAARQQADAIAAITVEIPMKSGDNGKLFGSVSSKEIAEQAEKQHKVSIDKKKIQLSDPIKTFGTYEVPVKLHPDVTAMVKVVVKES